MHAHQFFEEVAQVAKGIDKDLIEQMATELAALRDRAGRLFLLGVGGSAGNCSHAVNDFRKLCGIEAYAPTDNVSELTARTNDEGWDTAFSGWLRVSRANANDAVSGQLQPRASGQLLDSLCAAGHPRHCRRARRCLLGRRHHRLPFASGLPGVCWNRDRGVSAFSEGRGARMAGQGHEAKTWADAFSGQHGGAGGRSGVGQRIAKRETCGSD